MHHLLLLNQELLLLALHSGLVLFEFLDSQEQLLVLQLNIIDHLVYSLVLQADLLVVLDDVPLFHFEDSNLLLLLPVFEIDLFELGDSLVSLLDDELQLVAHVFVVARDDVQIACEVHLLLFLLLERVLAVFGLLRENTDFLQLVFDLMVHFCQSLNSEIIL